MLQLRTVSWRRLASWSTRKRLPAAAPRAATVVIALTLAGGLSGCGSMVANLPAPIGLPADAPARSTEPGVYPVVNEMEPPRTTQVLSEEQQEALEQDLAAARERAKKQAKPHW